MILIINDDEAASVLFQYY